MHLRAVVPFIVRKDRLLVSLIVPVLIFLVAPSARVHLVLLLVMMMLLLRDDAGRPLRPHVAVGVEKALVKHLRAHALDDWMRQVK